MTEAGDAAPARAAARATRDEHGRLRWEPGAGDVVRLRRPHVCGESRAVVTHAGLDVRLRCSGCAAKLMLTRQRLRSHVVDVLGTIADHPELRDAARED